MGLASLINRGNLSGGDFAIDYTPSGIIDVTKKAFAAQLENYNSTSSRNLQNDQIEKQYNLIKEIEGQSLEQLIGNDYDSDNRFKATDDFIMSKRNDNPKYNDVLTTAEMRIAASEKARESYLDLENTKKGASGFDSFVGEMLGGIGGAVFDPINIAVTVGSLGSGALLNASKIATQSAGRIMATEALIGAGTEVALQPFVIGWQKEVGNDYGLGDALTNVAFAGLVSGGIAGITSGGLKTGIRMTRDKGSVFFDTIAASEKTPAQIKPVMEKMSDYARVKETNPFNGVQGSKIHADNVKMSEDAFNARVSFEPVITKELQTRINDELSKISLDVEPYIAKAQQIKKELTTKKSIDVNNPKQLTSIIGYTPKGIAQFVKENGGVNDAGGDLKALGINKKMVGLVNKGKAGTSKLSTTATSIDTVLQKAHEAGYFPEKLNLEDLEIQDLIDALDNDLSGKKVYDAKTRNAINDLDTGRNAEQYYKMGVDSNMSDVEIANVLRKSDAESEQDLIDAYFKDEFNKAYHDDLYNHGREASYMDVSNDAYDIPEEEFLPRDYRAIETPTDEMTARVQAVEKTEFDSLLESDPNFNVILDDGTSVKLSNIANDIDTNNKINDAIKVCSI